MVQVTEVKSSVAAVLKERDDEGDLFVFDVGDGRLFWLHGQCIFPTMGNSAWPNDHCQIIESIDGGAELGIRGLGKRIKSVINLSHEEFASMNLPEDEIVMGTMENIRDAFA